VLFDRICRDNGIEHILTAPRSPTTTGKIERFHKTLRREFDTRRVFSSVKTAQQALDEWVAEYNTARPHQSLDDATPADRFFARQADPLAERPVELGALRSQRRGEAWVSRHVSANGVICVSWQQICVGASHAGAHVDVDVGEQLLQIWRGDELIKTVQRTSRGEVRKKKASVQQTRAYSGLGVSRINRH
jgi:integrase-like protein